MRRLCYFAGLLAAGCLMGCGAEPADPAAMKPPDSRQPGSSDDRPEIAPRDQPQPAPALPPAEVPMKRLYAKSFINKPAPEFVVEKWLTKEPSREGKMVLIDFWATWCPPCLKAIPELNQFHRKHKDRLVVVGLSDEAEEEVRAHRRPRMNYAVAIDTQRRMYEALAIEKIPHAILVDPSGIVRWEGYPLEAGHELTEEVIEDFLDTYVQ